MKLLQGKYGVVTGGGSGIGRAICHRLAEHGASIMVVDKNEKSAEQVYKSLVIKSKGESKHSWFKCDVSRSNQVKSLVEFTTERFGNTPNIIVNSAGTINDSLLVNMTEGQFSNVIDVNLKGTFLVRSHIFHSLEFMTRTAVFLSDILPHYQRCVSMTNERRWYTNIQEKI
ncbi:unnamed protein product [Anisakis simplex]|uniref:Estradiol 17-beta-dehydrogenase 8 (inferred by orthology to a human protein) n=1 Tax=Anisakis simplex TaxID=6269 RepID=A0A0M3J661_ANISI|nr:unnamed protein product [Anisakis simplex]